MRAAMRPRRSLDPGDHRLLAGRVGTRRVGIDVASVSRVIPAGASLPADHPNPCVRAMIAHDGAVLPLVDLGVWLGGKESSAASSRWAVVDAGFARVVLAADVFDAVIALPGSARRSVDATLDRRVRAVWDDRGEHVTEIDVAAVVGAALPTQELLR